MAIYKRNQEQNAKNKKKCILIKFLYSCAYRVLADKVWKKSLAKYSVSQTDVSRNGFPIFCTISQF